MTLGAENIPNWEEHNRVPQQESMSAEDAWEKAHEEAWAELEAAIQELRTDGFSDDNYRRFRKVLGTIQELDDCRPSKV